MVSPWLQRVVAPTLEASVVMVDTVGQAKERQVAGKTLANQREAWLVVTVVKTLLKVREIHIPSNIYSFSHCH